MTPVATLMSAAVLFAPLAAGSPATLAGPFVVPIDEAASSVTVEMCIPGGCDSDTSAVSGYTEIALDDNFTPTLIALHDFDLSLTDTIDINISILFGELTASGTDLRLLYATPEVPTGPVPVEGGAFLFVEVPTYAEGIITYDATGTVCVALQAAGLPCTDTINLADEGMQTGDMDGTIVVEDGIATLTFNTSIEVPLDPENPELGSLWISGVVTGSTPAPVPAISEVGIVVMALLLLTVGALIFRRRLSSTA
jgi:hypothetical protein